MTRISDAERIRRLEEEIAKVKARETKRTVTTVADLQDQRAACDTADEKARASYNKAVSEARARLEAALERNDARRQRIDDQLYELADKEQADAGSPVGS
jgi:hypothetical protein